MEPLDSGPRGVMPPPLWDPVASAAPITTRMPITPISPIAPINLISPMAPSQVPQPAWTTLPPSPRSRVAEPPAPVRLRRMAPWRIAGAVALAVTFSLMGWQVQRLIEEQPWSDPLMWMSVAAGVVAALCVLGWTWTTTDNARRLVEPAARAQLPDPNAAVRSWIVPFVFIAAAIGVVAVVGERVGSTADRTVSALPLGVAVVALLLAIPMTYRPMHHLAGVVRQVGGYTVRVAQWMWVPVVMALVGIASIVALRYAGVDDSTGAGVDDSTGTGATDATGTGATDAVGWVPLWVVAVVAIAPCVVTVLLAWRAASSVEDAISVAAARRRPGTPVPTAALRAESSRAESSRAEPSAAQRRVPTSDPTKRIELLPGAELLRLVVVTLLAGLALLSVVGAVVTAMLWLDSRDTVVLPAERQRTWDALDALRAASTGVTATLLVAVSAWTFVTVLNVRMTSGRRRNPLIAALSWPAATAAVWWIADRVIVDASIGGVMLGFVAQAAVLAVPFLVLERSADAVGARRTPLRVVYALVVVLLIHVQGLGGLSRLPESVTTTDIGRLSGYLAIGALIQLCSTLAVTEACHALSRSCRHEADHHNMLVGQRGSSADRLEPAAGR